MLSITAQYALRAMVQLARAEPGKPMLGKELALQTGVPRNYLSKVLLELKKSGLLRADRGSRGGYQLTREPAAIALIQIVEIFDKSRAHPRCLLEFSRDCSDHAACSAHEKWKSVRETYVGFLEVTSLAEIAGPEGDEPESSVPESPPQPPERKKRSKAR